MPAGPSIRSKKDKGMKSHAQSPYSPSRWRSLCAWLAAAVLMLSAAGAGAQTRKVMNRPYVDQRRLHYGFLAGFHMQDLELQHNGFTDAAGNQWHADAGSYEPGFSVGVLAELRLNQYLALRAIPSMHFGTRNMTFHNALNDEEQRQTLKSTFISLPLNLKFAAERFNNYRPYIVAGINPMYDLTVKKGQNLLLKAFDCYLEVGLGCDFYTPFFKFIPEIKFAYGLANVVNKNRSDLTNPEQLIFTNSIYKGRSKMIIFTFYFE